MYGVAWELYLVSNPQGRFYSCEHQKNNQQPLEPADRELLQRELGWVRDGKVKWRWKGQRSCTATWCSDQRIIASQHGRMYWTEGLECDQCAVFWIMQLNSSFPRSSFIIWMESLVLHPEKHSLPLLRIPERETSLARQFSTPAGADWVVYLLFTFQMVNDNEL